MVGPTKCVTYKLGYAFLFCYTLTMTKNHIENSGKPYTEDEIKLLKALAKAKASMKDICFQLGRSSGSIKNIAKKNNISLK